MHRAIALRNSNLRFSNPRSWRYDDAHLVDLAIVYYDTMGRRGYDTLRRTLLPGVLPTYETLRHHPRFQLLPITNVGYEIDRLRQIPDYYRRLGYTLPFFAISEDATVVRPGLVLRAADNLIFGFIGAAPVCPSTYEDLLRLVQERQLADQISVVLLNPLVSLFPSFVLAVFAQHAGVDADVTARRIAAGIDLLAQLGIVAFSHGADGAAANVSYQKRRLGLIRERTYEHQLVPSHSQPLRVPSLRGPDEEVTVRTMQADLTAFTGMPELFTSALVPVLSFQDFAHLLTKMRTRLLRKAFGLRLGDGLAHVSVLESLCGTDGQRLELEARTGLRTDDLNPADKQDFPAAERICSERVISLLDAKLLANEPCGDSGSLAPTILYLRLMSLVRRAYMQPGVRVLERLLAAFTAYYLLEIWLVDADDLHLDKKLFITTNTRFCIRTNALSLLTYYEWVASGEVPQLRISMPTSPHVFGSLQNEELFRELRALSHDVNFNLLEALQRLQAAQRVRLLVQLNQADSAAEPPLDLPRHHRHPRADSLGRAPEYMEPEVSSTTIHNSLLAAQKDAIQLWVKYAACLPVTVARRMNLPTWPAGAARPVLRLRLGSEELARHDLNPLDLIPARASAKLRNERLAAARPLHTGAQTAQQQRDASARLQQLQQSLMQAEQRGNGGDDEADDDEDDDDENHQLHWRAALAVAGLRAGDDVSRNQLQVHSDYAEYVHVDVGERDSPKAISLGSLTLPKARVVRMLGGHAVVSSERLRRVQHRAPAPAGSQQAPNGT